MLLSILKSRPKRLVLFHRFVHCLGCNAEFQSLTHGPGFRRVRDDKTRASIVAQNQARAAAIMSRLTNTQRTALDAERDEEGQNANAFSSDSDPLSLRQVRKQLKLTRQKKRDELYCRWCTEAYFGNSSPLEPNLNWDHIQDVVSRDAQVIHVLDAHDFPMSLDRRIIESFSSRALFVVARADLAVSRMKLDLFKRYCSDVLQKFGVSPNHVHVVSAHRRWGLLRLSEALWSENCFVGFGNCGKTTLLHSLAGINDVLTWPLPFTTQYPVEYKSTNRFKRIIDVPSLPETNSSDGLGVYGLLLSKYLRKIGMGRHYVVKNRFSVKPVAGKERQTIDLGGLLGIEIPPSHRNNAIHAWPLFGGFHSVLGRAVQNVDKIHELNCSLDQNHRNWSMLNESSARLPLVPVASLQADMRKDEIVVRALGPVPLHAYGQYAEPCIVKVHALKGLKIGLRPSLLAALEK